MKKCISLDAKIQVNNIKYYYNISILKEKSREEIYQLNTHT